MGERRLPGGLGTLPVGQPTIIVLLFDSLSIGIAIVDERLNLIINTGATIGVLTIGRSSQTRDWFTDWARPSTRIMSTSPLTVPSARKAAAWAKAKAGQSGLLRRRPWSDV